MESKPNYTPYPTIPPQMEDSNIGWTGGSNVAPPSYDQATSPMPMPMPQHQPVITPAQTYQPHPTQPHQNVPIMQNHPTPLGQPAATVYILPGAMQQLGPDPSRITCPNCHKGILTDVKYNPGTKTHLFAALLCLFGFWCCVCVPYCMDSCMNVNHYCPSCKQFLGVYNNGSL